MDSWDPHTNRPRTKLRVLSSFSLWLEVLTFRCVKRGVTNGLLVREIKKKKPNQFRWGRFCLQYRCCHQLKRLHLQSTQMTSNSRLQLHCISQHLRPLKRLLTNFRFNSSNYSVLIVFVCFLLFFFNTGRSNTDVISQSGINNVNVFESKLKQKFTDTSRGFTSPSPLTTSCWDGLKTSDIWVFFLSATFNFVFQHYCISHLNHSCKPEAKWEPAVLLHYRLALCSDRFAV